MTIDEDLIVSIVAVNALIISILFCIALQKWRSDKNYRLKFSLLVSAIIGRLGEIVSVLFEQHVFQGVSIELSVWSRQIASKVKQER